jgi:hypothetical protein
LATQQVASDLGNLSNTVNTGLSTLTTGLNTTNNNVTSLSNTVTNGLATLTTDLQKFKYDSRHQSEPS